MAEVPTVERVVQAVQALHTDPSPENKAAANTWLTTFQTSAHAWSVVDAILHADGMPMEVTFLAVQTLRSKMQRDFAELPAQQHSALRDSIIAHVHKFRSGPAVVTTQICLSLAGLAVQCEAWTDVVPAVIATFVQEGYNPANAVQILQLLPEECDSDILPVTRERRLQFHHQLGIHFRDVMSFLCQLLQQWATVAGAAPSQTLAIRCFGAWLGVVPQDVSMAEIAANPMVPLVFGGLASPDTFDACIDCVVHLVSMSSGPDSAALAEVVVPNVMALQPMFSQFMAAGDEAEDQALGMCRLFVELAEAHAVYVKSMKPEALQIVDALLLCGEHSVERIARMPFNFWYRLSQDVTNKQDPSHEHLLATFTPYFTRWMRSLIALLRYPDDYDSQPADKQDDFRIFRYAVADAVVDACMVIKSGTCLENFWKAFSGLMSAEVCSWQKVEAVLYGVRSIARYVATDEAVFLPQIMQAIPSLPAHRPLQYTAALTIGACAEWLPNHHEHLGPLFMYLVSCLDSADVADAAALSLKNVCDTCRHHFTEESTATSLMQLYEKTAMLGMGASVELTQAVTHAVSAMPEPMMLAALPRLVELPLVTLQEVISLYAAGATKETSKKMVTTLKRLAAVFQVLDDTRKDSGGREETRRLNVSLDAAHPCAGVVATVWNALDVAMVECIADSAAMENTCRVIKYMMATLQLHAGPMLHPLAQKLVACYQHRAHSCFLYLAATTVSIFGGHWEEDACKAPLQEMLIIFVQVTSTSVLSTPQHFTDNPDVVEDFFDFTSRFCRYCPGLILHQQPAVLAAIVECGMMGFTLQHRSGSKSLMDFFVKTVTLGTNASKYPPSALAANCQALQTIFRPIGEKFMIGLINGFASGLPSSRCSDAGVVTVSLRTMFGAETERWLYAALMALPQPRFTDEVKERCMRELVAATDPQTAAREVGQTLRQIASTPETR